MEKREERRARTARVVRRRYAAWAEVMLRPRGAFDPLAAWTPHIDPGVFSKRGVWTCGCRKRTHGRPHVGDGICYVCDRGRNVRERRKARGIIARELADSRQAGEVPELDQG